MYVRLLSAQGEAGAGDDAAMSRLIGTKVIPTVQQEPGFLATFFLFDRDQNKLTSLTFYENESDLRSSMESIKALRTEALDALRLRPVATDAYEVIASAGSLPS